MSTSSEDVLLQIPNVRYKKADGTLFLMAQRIIWMVENKDTVAVSHSYADIKSQKISPEGKAKVQLQVVLHSGMSSTFHFMNRNGIVSQIADRDRVKDMLQSLLPKFKRKIDRELEEKNKLLSSNPVLLQLYKDLVMGGVVTSEDFWSEYATKYASKQKLPSQDIGISGAFLADIKPQTDGCNGLKYNITPDIIECIFKTYPAVKKKYNENVPTKLSESHFWTKFFQSHYFHRDRKYAESKDIFTECGKLDDLEMQKDIQKGVDDLLVNVSEFYDSTLGEGYGSHSEKSLDNTGTVSQAMIKRFNHHSIMILKATQNEPTTLSNTVKDTNTDDLKRSCSRKRHRIQEKIYYEDLEGFSPSENHIPTKLHLSKVERYFHGPIPDTPIERLSASEVATVIKAIHSDIRHWQSRCPVNMLVTPASSVAALGELSPGGALMRGFQEQSLAQLVPADVETDVKNLYLALRELLSQFWKCFPPANASMEQKAINMHDALQRYHSVRLRPFEDKLLRELSPLSHYLTKHINQLLNAAYQKFTNWQKVKNW